MTIVDAHHHLWDTGRRPYPWMDGDWADPLRGRFGLAELTGVTAPHAVSATVVVQALSDQDETRELLALATGGPPIAGVVGWVDLADPDVAARIADLRAAPGGDRLAGLRHQAQDEADPLWLLRTDVARGLRAAAEADLVFDLLVKAREIPAALEVSRRLPELAFVLDHLGKPAIGGPAEPWVSHLAALAERPNVTAKLSGLVTEADWRTWTPGQLRPYVQHAVQVFGPDRLMWGSDWPVCTLAATYDRVLETTESALGELSAGERSTIFGGTARRVYRLK